MPMQVTQVYRLNLTVTTQQLHYLKILKVSNLIGYRSMKNLAQLLLGVFYVIIDFGKISLLAKTMSITVTAVQPNNSTGVIIIGASIAIPLMLSVILIISVIVLIWSYKRRSINRKLYTDSQYSTLSKETGQQIQLKSIQQDSAQLNNQVHLSPSTGQTEFIPKPESVNINSLNPTSQNSHPTRSTAGDEHSLALNAAYQEILSSQTTCESTSEQPTYAVVDEGKERKLKSKQKKKI